MVSEGEADYLVVLDATQVEVNQGMLKPGGVMLEPGVLRGVKLKSEKSINVALIGALSGHLPFSEEAWKEAILACLPEKLHAANLEAFELGRSA